MERGDRPGRQPVAADLVATVGTLLDDHDAGAGAGGPDGRGGTGGTTTDHRDVETFHTLDSIGRISRPARRPCSAIR